MTTPTSRYSARAGFGASQHEDNDKIVQQTDIDALLSRCSAIDAGYLHDEFSNLLVEKAADKARRYPLINRGTYVRTTALDSLVHKFLLSPTKSKHSKQIISLGAGSDSRYFKLKIDSVTKNLSFTYLELDFPQVTTRKVKAIREHDTLAKLCPDAHYGSDYLHSRDYYILPQDLRTLRPGASILKGMNPDAPTLFISECCLIYLAPNEADDILKWMTTICTSVGIVIYEPIGGNDAFGKVMIQNLAARGIVLKTLKKYSSLFRQKERLRVLGFTGGQDACDVDFIHNNWVNEAEQARIDSLEMLDEREEWILLARHYCIVWAWKEDGASHEKGSFNDWKSLTLQDIPS